MLNTGVFWMKVGSQYNIDLLNEIWGPDDSVFIDHPWWENAAMTWNFLKHVGMSETLLFEDHEQQKIDSNGQDMQGIYSDPVRTAPQIELKKTLLCTVT